MRYLHIRATLALLAFGATGAAAQTIDSPYRFIDTNQQVGPFVGQIWTDPGVLELGPHDGPIFGARYGVRMSGPFVFEGVVAVFPTSRTLQDVDTTTTDTTVAVGETDLTLGIVKANLRFDITGPRTWHRLLPYALFGLGAGFVLSEDDGADSELDSDARYDFGTRLVGDLGVGVEWIPTDRWSIRVDGRDMLWKIEAPEGLTTLDAPTEEWVQNFMVSVGVSWRF